jgi:hypothetical protein
MLLIVSELVEVVERLPKLIVDPKVPLLLPQLTDIFSSSVPHKINMRDKFLPFEFILLTYYRV